jgi:hypothetical protein
MKLETGAVASSRALRYALAALREAATAPCKRGNCGTVCKCMRCSAREALEELDPGWTP